MTPSRAILALSAVLAVGAAVPARQVAAQTPASPARVTAPALTAVGSAHELWRNSSGNVLAAAEQMPESRYGFKPTPEVRSFGEVVLHVAGGHQALCGFALGEKEKDLGKPTTKAGIVEALKSSMQYCERAYAMSDADAMQPATVFDEPKTRLHALMMNGWHDNEHYGNIVTYMRLQGMIPPSSQPRK